MIDRRLRICGQMLAITILVIIGFYLLKYPSETTFGERFVKDQIPLIFPFYVIQSFKPVTLLVILGFALWVIVIEIEKIGLWMSRPLTQVFLATCAFVVMYEAVWNFLAWFTIWIQQGGAIDVESEPGKGTTFRVRLPLQVEMNKPSNKLIIGELPK